MTPPPVAKIDEILPPETRATPDLARIIALWMDEFIQIPGTRIRFGLDPLLGVFPVVGGLISSAVSLVVLLEAVRLGIPKSVVTRMACNIVANDLLDSIPILGNIASVFFRSNSRNLALLRRWQTGDRVAVTRASRWIVAAVFAGFLVLLAGLCYFGFVMMSWMWHRMFGG